MYQKLIQLILFILLMIPTSDIFAQYEMDNLFRKYRNDKEVTHYNLKGDISKFFGESEKKFKTTVDQLDILIFKNKNDLSDKDQAKLNALLVDQKFEQLINFKEKKNKAAVYAIDQGNYLNKLVGVVKGEDTNFYLTITGKIHFEELAEMGISFTPENLSTLFDRTKK